MNSPLNRVKVPIGLYCSANKKGLLNTVKFYYRLKSLTIHGCFDKLTFLTICQDNLGVSYNTAKKYRNLLLKNKFAYYKDYHLYLVSYDVLWSLLNVQKINNRYKLIYTTCDNFDQEIYLREIQYNLIKQRKTIEKKFLQSELNIELDTVKNANKKLKKALLLNLNRSLPSKIKDQFKIIQLEVNSFLKTNFQCTLTCKKVAHLFGFKSTSQGHSIIQTLVSSGVIKSLSQRPLRIVRNITKDMFKNLDLDSSFYLYKKTLYKQLPNLITIL